MKSVFLKNKRIGLLLFVSMFCCVFVIVAFLWLSPGHIPPALSVRISSPFTATWYLQPISVWNVKNLESLHVFSQQKSTTVLKLSFSIDDCCVLAIHEDGLLENWRIGTGNNPHPNFADKLLAEYQLGKIHPHAVNFSADGSRLITPRQVLDDGKILGVNVWNPATGKTIFCEGEQLECSDGKSWDAQNGFLLDPSGKWLLGYSMLEEDYGFQNPVFDFATIEDPLAASRSGMIVLDDPYNQDPNAQVALAASDLSTQYFAFAFSNGLVRLMPSNAMGTYMSFSDGVKKTRVNVVDLAMDDTRTWLAELCDDELLVWNMQRWIRPLAFRVPAPKGTALAFDHTGQILAVATSDEIRLYDLNWGTVIHRIPEGATALIFSGDNRSLLTGDSKGVIKMWGIPTRQ